MYSTLILYSTMNADAGMTQLTSGKNTNVTFLSAWAFTYTFSTSNSMYTVHQQQPCMGVQGVSLSISEFWACKVYPFPQLTEECTCRVYPFPSPAVLTCRVYPFHYQQY
jgi:hypothetical protein